jgi:peptidyl-dipeptidase A
MNFMRKTSLLVMAMMLGLSGCAESEKSENRAAVTAADAQAFIQKVEADFAQRNTHSAKVAWVQANFMTKDTNDIMAQVSAEMSALAVKYANEAKKFNSLQLPAALRRKMDMLKLGMVLPAPSNAKDNKRLAVIAAQLDSMYASGKDSKGRQLGELSAIMASSKDPAALLDAWVSWRTISPAMKDKYAEMVSIANKGAGELGYKDVGAMWRGGYDMPADEFRAEADRLWGQVKPLYNALHCHVRAKLGEKYGSDLVNPEKAIPAHLLGNMWAQSWGNIYEDVAPKSTGKTYDLTVLLKKNNYDVNKMVHTAEDFFTSLGLKKLPETFWQRSLFTQPKDRTVQCHASAWNIDSKDDVRIKMCTVVTGEDFETLHHELGHNFYQRAYKEQSVLHQTGANDGFHEAIGDAITLSMTPAYLQEIGLLDQVPGPEGDLGLLMKKALNKVAFLPFGLMVDQWRWQVFNGELTPETYNEGWWALREKYQGVKAPARRGADAFDPGAKYHIPGNTPYMRYFLAHILQFQFHKAACDQAGFKGALHRCTIYGNKQVGAKLGAMLEMGASKPWPDALEAFTGTRKMDGSAVVEYFAPLKTWLDEQNKDRKCGW